MSRIAIHRRSDYCHFLPITTRWMDNDAYGHVNNVVYYHWFDTVVNQLLISSGVLHLADSPSICLVVETHCHYFSSIAFPDRVTAGLRVCQLGQSSVRYEIGIFRDDDDLASAQGHLVHVCVDRGTRRPTPIPESMRRVLQAVFISPSTVSSP